MSALPTGLNKAPGRRLRVTPRGLLGAVVVAVVLSLLVAALLGSSSAAVLVIVLGAIAMVAVAIWTAPAQRPYRPRDTGYAGGSYGGWGGDVGCGGGDGGGGC